LWEHGCEDLDGGTDVLVLVYGVPWWVGSVVEGLMGKPHVIDVDWTVLIVVFVTVGSKFFMCIFCKIVAEVMWAQPAYVKSGVWCLRSVQLMLPYFRDDPVHIETV
jgi:hypothetical protein